MFVQFSDSTKHKIVASFSCPQNLDDYPIQGEVDETDPRYQLFVIKTPKWDAIKAERERRMSGGFKVTVSGSDKWFHGDSGSRIQYLGLKDMARDLIYGGGAMTDNLTILGQAVEWKTMDGSFATITAQLAFEIMIAASNFDAQLFAVAEAHRASMEVAADPAAYDFSAGWPEIF